jgi:hypothetical protein
MVVKGQKVIDARIDPRVSAYERGTIGEVQEVNGRPIVFVYWDVRNDTEVLSQSELVWNEGQQVYVISRKPQDNELVVDPRRPDRIGRIYAAPISGYPDERAYVLWAPNLLELNAEIEKLDADATAYEKANGEEAELPINRLYAIHYNDLLWNQRWGYWVFA